VNQNQTDQNQVKILIVDDIPANMNLLRNTLEPQGYQIFWAPNGEVALNIAKRNHPDLILLDVLMPGIDGFETCLKLKEEVSTTDIPVIFVTAKDEMADIVKGFRAGGVDYITRPFEDEEILVRVSNHLKINQLTRELSEQNRKLTLANEQLQREIAKRQQAENEREQAQDALAHLSQQEASRWGIDGFVGKSKIIGRILADVRKLQSAGTTSVLITGESGTGKELIARAIHFGGKRTGAFIPVNCSAIPDELAESTLFGHVRGAFTGANTNRKGCFELADGGTLFLDEIGDMPLQLQPKLLRVLDDGCIVPLGGTGEKHVEVRILAATNVDLQAKIADGTFRNDLYFRLARFTVIVPTLRERKEDIPLLTAHFLNLFATEMGIENPTISPEASSILESYHFPGNVRELKNIIEHALILSGRSEIQPEHLHFLQFTPPSAVLFNSTSPTGSQLVNEPMRPQTELNIGAPSALQSEGVALRADTVGQAAEDVVTESAGIPGALASPTQSNLDTVRRFIDECCLLSPGAEIHKPEFLAQYQHFCQMNAYEPMSRNKFYKRVLQLCPQVEPTLIGDKRLAGFKGLRLKESLRGF